MERGLGAGGGEVKDGKSGWEKGRGRSCGEGSGEGLWDLEGAVRELGWEGGKFQRGLEGDWDAVKSGKSRWENGVGCEGMGSAAEGLWGEGWRVCGFGAREGGEGGEKGMEGGGRRDPG